MSRILSKKGAKILRSTSVTGVDKFNGTGRLIRLSGWREESLVFAKLVVAADGISSQVARLAGINTHLSANQALPCLSYRFDGVELKNRYHPITEQSDFLKPGFLWIVPTGKNQANIGLSISGTEGYKLQSILAERVKSDPALAKARITEKIVGCYPFSMPLENPFCDGLLIVGTAARLVDSSTGEGIIYAAESGQIAAQTFISSQYDNCAGSLSEYRHHLDPMYNVLRNIYSESSK
jgi:digeranylgeranylglycerophospholipid reductase